MAFRARLAQHNSNPPLLQPRWLRHACYTHAARSVHPATTNVHGEFPQVPLASMGAHGFRGYPWNPWAPKDSVGTQWNSCDRWIPKSQIPNLTSQSQFPCVVKKDRVMRIQGRNFLPLRNKTLEKQTFIHTGELFMVMYTPTLRISHWGAHTPQWEIISGDE